MSPVVPARRIYGADASPTPELEQSFFEGVKLPNGTFKTTADRRLDDFNQLIRHHLPPGHVRAKDVAVSSGITTLEWYDDLLKSGVSCDMTASDLQTRARLIECRGGLTVLVDEAGAPMQIDIAGFALRPDQIGRRERVIYALPLMIALWPQLRRHLAQVDQSIELISPRLARNPNVRVIEEDLMKPLTGEWDVVRAANLLNRGYFSDAELTTMIRHLILSVRPGGLLAICRTIPRSGNHGSVFRRGQVDLEELGRVGDGSEVGGLALALRY